MNLRLVVLFLGAPSTERKHGGGVAGRALRGEGRSRKEGREGKVRLFIDQTKGRVVYVTSFTLRHCSATETVCNEYVTRLGRESHY